MRIKALTHIFISAFVFLLLTPGIARADVGSSLVWTGLFHLLAGNALIGIFEGSIISRLYKTNIRRSIQLMIIANYISMIIGLAIMSLSFFVLHSLIFLAAGYILTILIEWPFCYLILAGQDKRGIRSFAASVLVQTVSYMILGGIYLFVYNLTMPENIYFKDLLRLRNRG
jgi:hypothetical protein